MIRQPNRSKYIFIVLLGILELMSIIGAYAAHHFTKTRMGMIRHVIYLNGKWEKMLPIPTIKWIVICILFILIISVYLQNIKIKRSSLVNIMVMIWTIVINGWTVYYLLTNNTAKNRAYYILGACFILMTVFQNILYYVFLQLDHGINLT